MNVSLVDLAKEYFDKYLKFVSAEEKRRERKSIKEYKALLAETEKPIFE